MGRAAVFGKDVERSAALLRDRLGSPDLGVVLGTGFAALAAALGAGEPVASSEAPGCLRVASASRPRGNVWCFLGRPHLYEGVDARRAALPVAVLEGTGARGVLLTCAAGGLAEEDQPGRFALVADHINLTGEDPVRSIHLEDRDPPFLDLHFAYDPVFAASWREAARITGSPLRDGVLTCVPGPCYETPAEVRMLRILGADLVSMSTVPEVIAARYLGLRVAAVACIANRGAGMETGATLAHGRVIEQVHAAVGASVPFFRAGVDAMLSLL